MLVQGGMLCNFRMSFWYFTLSKDLEKSSNMSLSKMFRTPTDWVPPPYTTTDTESGSSPKKGCQVGV